MVCLILETHLDQGITSELTVTFSDNLAAGINVAPTAIVVCCALIIKICDYVGSSSASTDDVVLVTSPDPVQLTFSVGDAPMGSPTMRCTSDFGIVDDSEREGVEEFDIFIRSPTNCLGNPSFAQVNIQDDDNGVLPLLFLL